MASRDDKFVIIDCDCGTDDAWALLALLRAEEVFRAYKILGITCVYGNSTLDYVANNTVRFLENAGRADISVFKGCSKPLLPCQQERNCFHHGVDGFGDVYTDDPVDETQFGQKHAVNAMYEFVKKHPNQITFILLGPLTNFATCLNMYDDFADNVKEVFIMGGNIKDKHSNPPCAEYNFALDPEAAHNVLERCKVPITILPWEPCMDIDHGRSWRLDVLGKGASKAIPFLNRAEEAIFEGKTDQDWIVADGILAAVYLFPSHIIQKQVTCCATVELIDKNKKAHMLLDTQSTSKPNRVRVVTEIEKSNFERLLLWAAHYPGADVATEWKLFE